MSGYEQYKASRQSWGIGVMGSIVVEIERERRHRRRHRLRRPAGGVVGGQPLHPLPCRRGCAQHLEDLGPDVPRLDALWPQGMPIATISVVDLALWDLVGKLRGEPVYNLIGGKCHDEISFYRTGSAPDAVKELASGR